MKKELAVTGKLLFRKLTVVVSCGAILGLTLAFLLYWQGRVGSNIDSMLEYVNSILRFSFLGILFFSFLSYEINSTIKQVGMEESLQTETNALWKLSFACCLWLLLPLTIWSGIIYFLQLFHSTVNSIYWPYALHTLKAILLYCYLPGIAGILLGACVQTWSRPKAYLVLIGAAVLSSPFLLERYAGFVIGNFSLPSVLDWFCLGAPNTTWTPDNVYGISMETCRWVLCFFWCAFLFLLLSGKVRPVKGKYGKVLLAVLLLVTVVCGGRYTFRGNDYIMNKDTRRDGILAGEFYYRNDPENQELLLPSPAEAFQVRSYDLDLEIGDYLKARVTITLDDSQLDQYGFTLFHTYHVKKVTDLSGKQLNYTRKGSWLDIAPEGADTIVVEYEGRGGKYFADRQGVALPGYFAYYPIPGHQETGDSFSDYGVITGQQPTEFSVKIKSPLTLYSNLPERDKNSFYGTAECVTLMGGILEETEREGARYVDSPMRLQPLEIQATELEELWGQYQDSFDLEEELSVKGKTVFIQPSTISGIDGHWEGFVPFQDHVLLAESSASSQQLCEGYLMSSIPCQDNKRLLWEALSNYLAFDYGENFPEINVEEKPARSRFSLLMKYENVNETTDKEFEEYCNQEQDFYNLFCYQVKALGEDGKNQAEFLYDLGG